MSMYIGVRSHAFRFFAVVLAVFLTVGFAGAASAAGEKEPKVVEVARDIDLGSPDLRLPRTPKDPDALVALSDKWGLGGSVTRLVETLTDLS